MPGILEICCTSLESVQIAAQGGANRVELCNNLWEGGTTPSSGMIREVKAKVDIGLYVLIRPRGGDFVYSKEEFDIMLADIDNCKQIGVDGIVSGILTKEGTVDVERTKQLVKHGGNLDFTFHRAFDTVVDPIKALGDVIATGASRILSSGLKNSVSEGAAMLKKLTMLSGNEIRIMAGGGLNSSNMVEVSKQTGCKEYHSTAKSWVDSVMKNKPHVRMNGIIGIPEDKNMRASLEEVKKLRLILDEFLPA